MDKDQQQKIYQLLKRGLKMAENGEELPADWARELFPPERREYELIYYGKETEEQILADTMAVPLQPISTFGTNGVDWHNKLIFGDNLQAMKTLLQMKKDGKLVNSDGTPGVRLIYVDPPFSTKRDFRGSQDQKAYQDKIAGAEFLEFLRERLILLRELLSHAGAIYVHLDWKKGHYVKVLMDEIFGENNFLNNIVWCYKTRQFSKKYWNRKHDDILVYKKGTGQQIFNWSSKGVIEDYSKSTIKKYKLKDEHGYYRLCGRGIAGSPIKSAKDVDSKWEKTHPELVVRNYLGEGFAPSDYWNIEIVNQAALERIDYPTQKPEALLEKIIMASSNKGDIVLDTFAGSGTTCAVAEKLKRRWIAIDSGKLAIYTIQERILNLRTEIGNTGKLLAVKPFTLYNAGLYDFETLRELPWEDWRFFALQLFECKDDPHKIHGFQMDGKRQGSSVHIFNHFDKGTVSRETIADIHASIGRAVGDRCFVIAPRGAFLFQEDYIEMDSVRYYALRIPYSYINELHRREFSALSQPNDEMAINETVEAVGFDFIQPPLVELCFTVKKEAVSVNIKKFQSRARLRGEEKISKHDALSMVMVDYDYNGKVFNLDKAFYASAIKEKKWKIELHAKEIKGDVMLVILDIYGNESRIVVEKNKLIQKVRNAKSKK